MRYAILHIYYVITLLVHVSAVLSLSYSSSTILAANLMKTYKLPLVSIWATSEEVRLVTVNIG